MKKLLFTMLLGVLSLPLWGCSSDGVNASNCYGRAGNGCVEKYGEPQFGYAYPDKVLLPDGHGGLIEKKWGQK